MRTVTFVIILITCALLPLQAVSHGSGFFRGHLTLGHEVRSFIPCEKEVDYWVVDRTGGELWKVYQRLTHKPYQPVYVEVRGHLEPPPADGFGADYARQLTVFELRRAGIETRGCAEDMGGIAFRASGNEPFWNVEISENEILFSQLGQPKIAFPYAPPHLSETSRVYRSSTKEHLHHRIKITLHEKRCIDSMSGEHFSFAARVSLDGREYLGCAREGSWLLSRADSGPLKPITIHALKNAEYKSEFSLNGRIRLFNGIYRGKIVPDSATELSVILSDQVAFGDLNGDGADDAAVVLITDPGGSGTFRHLGVVINEKGSPQHVASQLLGDRVRVKFLSVNSGEIVVQMMTHGPNDPMCCPTFQVMRNYVLQEGKLVIAGVRELMKRKWALRYFGAKDTEDPLVPRTEVSLEFAADGKLHGSGGCNRYFAAYEIGPGDSLKIKNIGSTRMACPREFMDQEMRYFEALQRVSAFRVQKDLLQLFYEDGRRVLNFKPSPSR
ncbi:MAG: META domain-containing protein [Desulfobacteraceae bacterium]